MLLFEKEKATDLLSNEQMKVIEGYNLENSDERGFIDYVIDFPKLLDAYVRTVRVTDIFLEHKGKLVVAFLLFVAINAEGSLVLTLVNWFDTLYDFYMVGIVLFMVWEWLRHRWMDQRV